MIYYNDNDQNAVKWLEKLVKRKLIPDGVIDSRSIKEVKPEDVKNFRQCHFFAGIGGWVYALELAGWPSDAPVWTGSCPCQPFSVAGKQKAEKDPRHLWPDFFHLISECRPATIFGEQVAQKAGRVWLDRVRLDLASLGYAVGAADLAAASVGAPHIRQRLWWVADTQRKGSQGRLSWGTYSKREDKHGYIGRNSPISWVADAEHSKRRQETTTGNNNNRQDTGWEEKAGGFIPCRAVDIRMGISNGTRCEPRIKASETTRYWNPFITASCRDGKQRRIPPEPYLFPLAHGLPGRVGLLRGIGNAIVPQIAAEFIGAYLDATTGDKKA